MPNWVEKDEPQRLCWFYNVRSTYGTVNGPAPVEYPIAFVEYWKTDPFGYRASTRGAGGGTYQPLGVFDDLQTAKTQAEHAVADAVRLLAAS
jgi:hypothetical protein